MNKMDSKIYLYNTLEQVKWKQSESSIQIQNVFSSTLPDNTTKMNREPKYREFHDRARHLPEKMPSEGKLYLDLRKLIVQTCFISLKIFGDVHRQIELDLRKDDDRDLFYSEMMKWSLTHSIAIMKGDFFLELYLNESKDNQTNITIDIIDSIYDRMIYLENNRMYEALGKWERSCMLSA